MMFSWGIERDHWHNIDRKIVEYFILDNYLFKFNNKCNRITSKIMFLSFLLTSNNNVPPTKIIYYFLKL